jgi:hypothetical protein
MNKHTNQPIGFRHSLSAVIACAVTAILSWSFVRSTATIHWLGSDAITSVATADSYHRNPDLSALA